MSEEKGKEIQLQLWEELKMIRNRFRFIDMNIVRKFVLEQMGDDVNDLRERFDKEISVLPNDDPLKLEILQTLGDLGITIYKKPEKKEDYMTSSVSDLPPPIDELDKLRLSRQLTAVPDLEPVVESDSEDSANIKPESEEDTDEGDTDEGDTDEEEDDILKSEMNYEDPTYDSE